MEVYVVSLLEWLLSICHINEITHNSNQLVNSDTWYLGGGSHRKSKNFLEFQFVPFYRQFILTSCQNHETIRHASGSAYMRTRLWQKSVKIDPLSVHPVTKLSKGKSTIAYFLQLLANLLNWHYLPFYISLEISHLVS